MDTQSDFMGHGRNKDKAREKARKMVGWECKVLPNFHNDLMTLTLGEQEITHNDSTEQKMKG